MNTEHARAPLAVLVLTGPPSSLPLQERARSRVPLVEVRFDLLQTLVEDTRDKAKWAH